MKKTHECHGGKERKLSQKSKQPFPVAQTRREANVFLSLTPDPQVPQALVVWGSHLGPETLQAKVPGGNGGQVYLDI